MQITNDIALFVFKLVLSCKCRHFRFLLCLKKMLRPCHVSHKIMTPAMTTRMSTSQFPLPVCLSQLVCLLMASLFSFSLLYSMGPNFAGSQWTVSSPESLRSFTGSYFTFTASLIWRWWLAMLTSMAIYCRSTTMTTSARRCQQLIHCSGSSYRDKVGCFESCEHSMPSFGFFIHLRHSLQSLHLCFTSIIFWNVKKCNVENYHLFQ